MMRAPKSPHPKKEACMLKRSAIAVAVTLVLAVSAFARTSEPVNNVGGVFMQPLAQRFNASGFWLALHPQIATVTTDADGLLPAPGIDLEKKQRDEITVTAVTPRPNGNDKDHGKPKDIVIVKAGSFETPNLTSQNNAGAQRGLQLAKNSASCVHHADDLECFG